MSFLPRSKVDRVLDRLFAHCHCNNAFKHRRLAKYIHEGLMLYIWEVWSCGDGKYEHIFPGMHQDESTKLFY